MHNRNMGKNQKESSSIMKVLENSFKKQWDRPLFSDYNSSVNYTYGEVYERIVKIHLFLRECGIKPGDKVALCDKNSSNWGIIYLGLFTYKAVIVPLLADFNVEQIVNLVEHSESKLLFTNRTIYDKTPELHKMAVDVKTLHPFDVDEASEQSGVFNRLDDVYEREFPNGVRKHDVQFDEEEPEDLSVISYTSGSTGNPKGVMLSYRAMTANNTYGRSELPLKPNSSCLSLLPLAHMFGMAFDFIYPITLGCHIHFLTRMPSPNIVLKAFAEIRPVLIISVPLIIEKIIQGRVMPMLQTRKMRLLMKIPGVRDIIYSQIKKKIGAAFGGKFYEVILGGAGVNSDVETLLNKIRFPYTIGYGMTECAPLICYSDWRTFVKGSCGRAIDGVEIDILSDDPENVPGEIVCRGPVLMSGYYKNPEATEEAIDKEGWLHTGDLGTIDRKGNLFIRGRKKNMLLGANGQNIYPEEIEDVLMSQSLIDEVVVVQREHKLVALIYTSENTLQEHDTTREELLEQFDDMRQEVNVRLPKFSQIAAFELRDEEFEKTPKKSIKRFLYK